MDTNSFTEVLDKAQIRKAAQLPPMSIAMLFRKLFGARLDRYKVEEKEYLRLIYTEIQRLEHALKVSNARICQQSREIDRLRQLDIAECITMNKLNHKRDTK